MNVSIGIDLGTTNTVVSLGRLGLHGDIEVDTQKIEQISDDRVTPVLHELLPSILYVEDDIPFVGQIAKAMMSQNRKHVIINSKSYMGIPDYSWKIKNKEYTPEIVASHFLKAVRKCLSMQIKDPALLDSAVITVPASFDIDQKRATKAAARLAGFQESKVILISEPTSAMLDFINQQKKYSDESKLIDFNMAKKTLVFDLGGGTCDVAILNISINKDVVNIEEIAVSPHTLVGGTNFDTYAMLGIIDEYNQKHHVNLEETLGKEEFDDLKYQLLGKCERAKLYFSGRYSYLKANCSEDEFRKKADVLNYNISLPNIGGKAFEYDLTMKEYDKMIEPLLKSSGGSVDNIIDPIIDTLKSAGFQAEDIDNVFCVGGMTMYPAVVHAVTSFFGKEPLFAIDRMMSVSRGAAVFHYYKVNIVTMADKQNQKLKERFDIIPAMPQTIFLNVKNGLPLVLISEGTKAGTPVQYDNLLQVESELSLELELYAGRSVFDPKLKKLKKARLEFPRGIPRGTEVSLLVEYTDIGVLTFNAWLTEDKNVKIQVHLDDLYITDKQIVDAQKYYKLEELKGVMEWKTGRNN